MGAYVLTTGNDTIVGTSGNDTVYATAASLNAGDTLEDSTATPIETSGTTRLDQVVNEFFLHDSGGNGLSLKYLGSAVTAGQFGAWTPVGVEKVGGGYQVVWKNGSADQYTVWNLDSNGNYASSATGWVSGTDKTLQAFETPFQQDLNGDGTTGLKTTPIETSGTTRLDRVVNEFFLHDSGGNGLSLKYLGSAVTAGQFGAWTPVGVEKVGGGYQVVWKNGSADQYTVWNLDSNGNYASSATGWVSGTDKTLQAFETPFQQDLNGDGTTGLKTTPIETSGTTRLDRVVNEFFLHDSGGNGLSLKYLGSAVTAGQFGAWTPVGVEKVGGGYQVVWKNGSADQYTVWNLDSNGNYASSATGWVSGTDKTLQAFETPFQQDLNGDGVVLAVFAISALAADKAEGNSGTTPFTFTITRTGDTGAAQSVFWSLAGSGANPASASDFMGNALPSGTVSFAAGETTKTITVNIAGDTAVESDEGFTVTLSNPSTGATLGTTSAVGTIRTDDASSPGTGGDNTAPALQSISLSTSQLDFGSGQKSLVVTVHLSDDISGLFDGISGGALASISFRSPSGQYVSGSFDLQHPVSGNQLDGTFQATIQLPANAEAGTWTVQSLYVVDEAGNSKSLSPVTTPALGSTTFQVLNSASDNTAPALQSISLSTSQLDFGSGQKSLVVTVHLSDDISGLFDGISGGALASISFRSPSGQYVSGSFDLQHPVSGNQLDGTFQATIQLPANAEAGTWTVQSLYVVDEAGNSKSLSPVTTPALGSTTFQVLDSASHSAVFSIESAQASQAEGQSGTTPFTFTITRTGDTGSAHSVFWSLTGSGANPASASDFVGNALPNGTVSFAAGETSKTVTVNIAGDTVVESDEGLTVTLSSPSAGATLGTASAIGTIRNDDAVLSIATASADKAEGQSGTTPFTFTITRTGDTGSVHNVSWSLAGSGANPASASDFMGNALPSGTVSFAAGETSKTVTVNVAGDTGVESDEGFTVTLSSPSAGATLSTASAIGTIRNDDASSPGTGGDNTAPALQSISLSTSQLNMGSGQTSLVVTAHLSDDISGLSDGIGGLQPNIVFRSPSGAQVWASFDTQHPVSGNQLDGTFRATIQLPANAEAGNWTVDYLVVADEAGNTKFLHPSDTPALSSATFQVLNSASDGAAPVLQSINLSTSQLNMGSGQTSLVVTAHLSDDISGLSDGIGGLQPNIVFRSPSGAQVWASFDIQHPVSGNQLDGTFRATVQLPANAEAGNWTVDYLVVADEAGNTKFLHPSDTPALSSATFQVLNSASHGAVFSVESVQASQSEGQSITTADTFTATLGEDHGGAPTPGDGQSHDGLDEAIALSSDGSTAIVGRWSDDVGANADQGSAQVFIREGGDWTLRGAALTASDGQAEDWFGQSAALSSDGRTAIIGGPGDDVAAHGDQGSARVLAWDGNAWTQRGGALTPGDGQAGDHFGASIALSSDGLTVIVGGPQHDVGANMDQGSAYVFTWDGGEWVQRGDALTCSEGGSGSHLGSSVALSSDGLTATVGATGDNAPLVLHWEGSHWI